MTTFPPDWNEFIGLLNAHRVRFLIVGAHALAAHGRPRATQDLDIFIDPSPANVERLAQALHAFGFLDLAGEANRFCEPERMATLGSPPLRIDIMNYIDGVAFADAWKDRVRAKAGDHTVGFLSLAALRKNKRAAARPKDLLDLALIDEMERLRKTGSRKSGARKPLKKHRRDR